MPLMFAKRAGDRHEGIHGPRRGFTSNDAGCLQDNNDAANPAHEARNHGIGYEADVGAESQHAKKDLDHASQHHRRKDERRLIDEGRR